ncbi:hypothetical protein MCOR27_007803 [Pyricularia oryzae]|uniref:Uncharacterized protein n=5 Tax=Pyricularia TaxID=48558 RepID=A0ABQ8NQV6_PYRGI|nr:uncharacterized protein MGG_17516 [Pyricularia oryzae 70-15]ELQ34159.1 hypothetical protein OOU_Y34scaffold00793g42 [Pyricularia oryzae Y34]KAH8841284.1 hypothetical protein MCOR01_007956 [Pyricularia oryzae]KAI6300767.1 hypothetical protein MCOR33_003621 [Pyricularia grisea]EHA49351.1 hypothetical protein MGG_17516 [Pyricularia oryzae 70-15]KAI6273559.1 hypothetical protein MCOR27_007803 [Pyricularia oryzae]
MSRGQAGNPDHASQSANCHVCMFVPGRFAFASFLAERLRSAAGRRAATRTKCLPNWLHPRRTVSMLHTFCRSRNGKSGAQSKRLSRNWKELRYSVRQGPYVDRPTLFWGHEVSGDQMCINHSARRNYTRAPSR